MLTEGTRLLVCRKLLERTVCERAERLETASAFASSGWIGPITMVMPLVAASALSIEVPDSALRHSTHAALLNPISPRSVCPSGRSSAFGS